MKARTPLLAAAVLAGALASPPAMAQADPFIGQMMTFAGNFCPRGWAEANGQLLSIASNSALFSLLGTQFGGDGRTTFGLPDLQGRMVVGEGTGAGLSPVRIGEKGGAAQVSITVANMPPHSHTAQVKGTASNGNTDNPTSAVPARLPRSNIYSSGGGADATMATQVDIGTSGAGASLNVRNPYLGMVQCIALVGVYPSRS